MGERTDLAYGGTSVRVEGTPLGEVPEFGMTYNNGVSTDVALNNVQIVLVPGGARTVAPAIATQANLNHRGVLLFLNVTAAPAVAAASLTFRLQAIEPVTGTATVALLSGAAIVASTTANSAVGLYTYALYPGLPNTAAALGGLTLAQNGVLPRVWTASVTPGTTDSWTYSLAGAMIL
jgi:hypothetical protein